MRVSKGEAMVRVDRLRDAYQTQNPIAGKLAMDAMVADGSEAIAGRLWFLARKVAETVAGPSRAETQREIRAAATAIATGVDGTAAQFAAKLVLGARDEDWMVYNLYAYKTTGKGTQFVVDVIGQLLRWWKP